MVQPSGRCVAAPSLFRRDAKPTGPEGPSMLLVPQRSAPCRPPLHDLSRRRLLRGAAGAGLAALTPGALQAMEQRLDLPPEGTRRIALEHALRGRNDARFVFEATAGERLRVRLAIRGAEARFNIWAPDSRRALFISNRAADPYAFDGALPATGEYAIQVFLAGAAARGDQDTPFALDLQITPGLSG